MESLQQPDAVLIGAGIMSVTLASLLKRLDPSMEIVIYEVLSSEAQESSNAWNNAGTGHAALCELNYTPEDSSGNVDISKALTVNTEFDLSHQFWSYLVREGAIKDRRFHAEAEMALKLSSGSLWTPCSRLAVGTHIGHIRGTS